MNVLYVKASVERRPAFRQQTRIIRDETGIYAEKIPVGPEAKEHVRKYTENYRLLEDSRKMEGIIKLAPCGETEDGNVRFPFISAPTLAEELRTKTAGEYAERVKEFARTIQDSFEETEYNVSNGFEEVFGAVKLPAGLQALRVTNLDMNFDNVFLTGSEEYTLIDYEWVFPFPVPIVFILFRSLFSDSRYGMFSETERETVLNSLGIDDSLQSAFWEMELKFQKYVSRDEDKLENYLKKDSENIPESKSFEKILAYAGEYDHLSAGLDEYKTAYEEQQKAIQTLNSQLDEYKGAYDEQQAAIQTLDSQLEEYKAAHDEQQEAIQTLNSQLDEYKAAYDRQQETIRDLCVQIEDYRLRCEAEKGEKERIQHEFNQYQTEISSQWWYKAFCRNKK